MRSRSEGDSCLGLVFGRIHLERYTVDIFKKGATFNDFHQPLSSSNRTHGKNMKMFLTFSSAIINDGINRVHATIIKKIGRNSLLGGEQNRILLGSFHDDVDDDDDNDDEGQNYIAHVPNPFKLIHGLTKT